MQDFLEFHRGHQGTYVGAVPDAASIETLSALQDVLGIKEPLAADKFHTTVLYSRNPIEVTPKAYNFKAVGVQIESWETQDGTHACVLKLECPDLTKRHQELIDQGGTHDFPDYQPHITLSYNHKLDQPYDLNVDLIIGNEYTEPLDLDWVKNN